MYNEKLNIVIGYPRTGFSLLISIIIELLNYKKKPLFGNREKKREDLIKAVEFTGYEIANKIISYANNKKIGEKIIFNKNFQSLLGGPNWLDDSQNSLCVRKYIGFKDHGDLTLIISLPKEIMHFYAVPHSHGPFKPWIDNSNSKNLFSSIRSACGTINSACHSINAITSEYFQKYLPHLNIEETEKIRQDLALSKLTNLDFFDAMLQPMKKSFLDLIENKSKFKIIKWEDIITYPTKTIVDISNKLKIKIQKADAEYIWKKISYRNLTNFHKHNFRETKGYLGNEWESLTNEHINILKENGFDEISEELNFDKLNYLNESEYTSFQKKASEGLKKGKVIDNVSDRELYWFAFQKSNIDFTKFDFKTYDWREYTKLERTNIKDDEINMKIWDIAESETKKINETFKKYFIKNSFKI